MYYLIYLSSSTPPLSAQALESLIHQARIKNARLGITGLLIHRDGNFIQYLEGERDDVQSLYSKISLDPRHTSLIILNEGTLETRLFDDWAMESKAYLGTPIFSEKEMAQDGTGIKSLLSEFIQGLR